MAVNAIAVQYVRRVDPSSLLAALQIAELLLVILVLSTQFAELTIVIFVTNLSVRRTDRIALS